MPHLIRWTLPALIMLCLPALALSVSPDNGSDLSEFRDADDAVAFGWQPVDGTRLSLSNDRKAGRHALRIDAQTDAGEYSGVDLHCTLDLTGAGRNDKLSFFVKQNYGSYMRVQLWTEGGPINRTFRVNQNEWTRVQLDMDLANWDNPNNAAWSMVTRIQFYEKSFAAAGQFMILDAIAMTARGKRVTPGGTAAIEQWTFPHETADAWRLGNEQAAWSISKSTGQIIGGWNARTRTPYLLSLVGRYHLDDPRTLTTGIETDDVVTDASFDSANQRIELTCSNRAVPDLIITKQYWIRGNKLFQRVGFTTTSDTLQFITYNAQARFEISYRNRGYYLGGGDGGGPLVPAPQLAAWQKITQHQNTPKGMTLSQPELQYSFAQVRTRLDNTFVWPWFTGAIASYCEPNNIMHYTPDGWDMSLGTSKLSQTNETSFEQYVTIFEGDWQTFHRDEYSQLPEVKAALAEIPPTPEWVADIYADASGDVTRLQYLLDTTDEGNIMVLVDLGGSWADYYVDKGINGGWGGGRIEAEELRDLIQRLKAMSPRVKVGVYMWVLSTSETTSIFQAHPEWFRLTNKDGEPLNTFPGLIMNFAHILSIRECYDELLSQFDLMLEYLDTDFIYLDDPKAINSIDWTSGEFNRDDISFQFFLDIKRIAASHGPDKMVFFNNRGNPYADVNYIEARSTLDANFWRQFAGIAAAIEQFTASTTPNSRIVPLYYVPPHDREYINHVLALGWIPDLANSNTDQLIERRGFAQAAYEVGNASPVAARYSPDWKRDKDTQVESFAMQRDGDTGYLLSFIDHEKTPRVVPVEIDLSSLSLSQDQPVFIWRYVVENANEFKGTVTEGMAREAYANAGWLLDHVTRRTLVYCGPYRDTITLDMDFEPLLLNQLYITSQPTAVYAQNNLTSHYLFNQVPRVAQRDASDWTNGTIELQVESQREAAQIIAFLPQSRYRLLEATVDGRAVEPQQVFEGGDMLPVITVERGSHTVRLRFEATNATTPVAVAPVSAQAASHNVHIEIPGHDDAAITIERDGRIVYNRVSQRGEHGFQLPIALPRGEGGNYTVTLRALVADDGTVTPTDATPIAIDLPAAPRDERLIAPRPAIMPGSRQIADVNRTIDGVRVLRAATVTTNTLRGTFQPNVEALMAEVDPDALSMQAGTTSKIEHTTRGAAFAGLEITDVRKLKVQLNNTFYSAFHLFGKGLHMPPWNNNTRPFAGIIVDYHTPAGYTKRVALATGVMHADCSSVAPDYGKAAVADEFYDLGKSLIESPEQTFVLDLERFAPDDWDGQVWLSVGSDWVASDRRLTMRILAVNDAASGAAIDAIDPHMIMEAFLKPKSLHVPRSPGGIIIDGPSDEEMWRGAAITDRFYLHGGEGLPEADTTAKLLYDDDNLYVAFVCEEPDRVKPLVLGGAVWNDDEVEIWLDINGDQESFTQVLVNGVNSNLVYSHTGALELPVQTAALVTEGERWMVEMAIPFKALGIDTPKRGDTWRISLCRYRPGGQDFNDEVIVWAPLQREGFRDLANFGTLVFD